MEALYLTLPTHTFGCVDLMVRNMVFILNIQVVDKRGGQREMREGRERDDKGEVVATGGL